MGKWHMLGQELPLAIASVLLGLATVAGFDLGAHPEHRGWLWAAAGFFLAWIAVSSYLGARLRARDRAQRRQAARTRPRVEQQG